MIRKPKSELRLHLGVRNQLMPKKELVDNKVGRHKILESAIGTQEKNII